MSCIASQTAAVSHLASENGAVSYLASENGAVSHPASRTRVVFYPASQTGVAFHQVAETAAVTHLVSQKVPARGLFFFAGLKELDQEADYIPLSSFGFKNARSYIPNYLHNFCEALT